MNGFTFFECPLVVKFLDAPKKERPKDIENKDVCR